MVRRSNAAPALSFDDQLILFRYFLRELGIESLSDLGRKLNTIEYEGVNESGNTYFFEYIARISRMKGAKVSEDQLRLYDENICRHTRQISEKRGPIRWKYCQYISLLFTEMYLDRYFSDKDAFCKSLNGSRDVAGMISRHHLQNPLIKTALGRVYKLLSFF